MGPVLIERYGKDFVDAWNAVFDNLKLKSMSADKPQYLALSAASSPTSPIGQLFEAVALETQLTREPADGELAGDLPIDVRRLEADAQDAAKTIAKYAADRAAARATGLARIGIELAMKKSQSRAAARSRRRRSRRFPAPTSRRSSARSMNWSRATRASGRSMR